MDVTDQLQAELILGKFGYGKYQSLVRALWNLTHPTGQYLYPL